METATRRVDAVVDNKVIYIVIDKVAVRIEPHEARRLTQRLNSIVAERDKDNY